MALGAVDVVVRRVNEAHAIEEVGLSMEHVAEARPRMPLFQRPHEIWALASGWLGRVRKKAVPATKEAPRDEPPPDKP